MPAKILFSLTHNLVYKANTALSYCLTFTLQVKIHFPKLTLTELGEQQSFV